MILVGILVLLTLGILLYKFEKLTLETAKQTLQITNNQVILLNNQKEISKMLNDINKNVKQDDK